MKRTLILDDSELIMVGRKDIVEQIDENRGEMTRTEFVNLLIHNQLKEFYRKHEHVTWIEFYQFAQEMKDIVHNVLELLLSYAQSTGNQLQPGDLEKLNQQLKTLGSPAKKATDL